MLRSVADPLGGVGEMIGCVDGVEGLFGGVEEGLAIMVVFHPHSRLHLCPPSRPFAFSTSPCSPRRRRGKRELANANRASRSRSSSRRTPRSPSSPSTMFVVPPVLPPTSRTSTPSPRSLVTPLRSEFGSWMDVSESEEEGQARWRARSESAWVERSKKPAEDADPPSHPLPPVNGHCVIGVTPICAHHRPRLLLVHASLLIFAGCVSLSWAMLIAW